MTFDMIDAFLNVLRAASARQDAPSSSPGTPGITLLLVVLAAWVVIRRFTMMDLFRIPTPWGSPFIGLGHLLRLALHVSNGHEQFIKWHEAYGPIVRLRLLHRDVVIVADPQVASELLSRGPNECPKRTPEYTLFNAVSLCASVVTICCWTVTRVLKGSSCADCCALPATKTLAVLSLADFQANLQQLLLLEVCLKVLQDAKCTGAVHLCQVTTQHLASAPVRLLSSTGSFHDDSCCSLIDSDVHIQHRCSWGTRLKRHFQAAVSFLGHQLCLPSVPPCIASTVNMRILICVATNIYCNQYALLACRHMACLAMAPS
jgi:hypothetical protein